MHHGSCTYTEKENSRNTWAKLGIFQLHGSSYGHHMPARETVRAGLLREATELGAFVVCNVTYFKCSSY